MNRKCPRKHDEMAIAGSNTFPPRMDPPKARNVREFYTEFWSTPRPEGTLPSAEQLADLLYIAVGGFLAPIGIDEIIRRLAREQHRRGPGQSAQGRKPEAVSF